ncbi:MAG: phosphohydrolase [Pseudomonadales bacterium RIFCSPLOWO2_12_59_9]|nr:MAG: phosphohydrolase [Pseudomonadales bacterium RIFCSPLOWO2_12_59_9]
MTIPCPADLSNDLVEDFRLDAAEQFPRCEQLLIELEHFPTDEQRLHELFRIVHNLKGNLSLIGLDALTPLPQAIEEILDGLRESRLNFDSLLGDVLLLSFDHLRELIREALGGAEARLNAAQLGALCQALHALALTPSARQTEQRRNLLQQLDPSTQLQLPPAREQSPVQHLLNQHGIGGDADLSFFAELMQASEQRSRYWAGRGQRLLSLTLTINALGGSPVAPAQLATAVCLHDLGMAFLPLDLLHKEQCLSREERRQMQSHPRMGFDLLRKMPSWAAASEIILQHQEHADGSGYPKALTEAEICPGALILNIVDTFDARTHERAHQTLSKRPLIRAILEINDLAGSQFSSHWVEVFNRALQTSPHLAHS